MENSKEEKTLNHLKWLYPCNEVVKMGTEKYGIVYTNLIFRGDLDKINEIGFQVECIQDAEDRGLIITISDGRKDRPNI